MSHLPFPEGKFDLVTAVETHYYWPSLVTGMQEILRVLKPGGTLIRIAETYKNGRYDKLRWPVTKLLESAHLSVEDHRDLFSTAGYKNSCGVSAKAEGAITASQAAPGSAG